MSAPSGQLRQEPSAEQHAENKASGRAAPGLSGGVPRLMIKKMVLTNFKSYAGVKEIGPFHKSFSSVVGPNGSGKSNVIDALQFVFGRRATAIRLKKLNELIHHSGKFPNLEFCSVAVHFHDIVDTDDQDGYEAVAGSDFVVTRTVNKQGVSKYYLDERLVTSGEVTDKLKEKGIDLDYNRFLILQGEVEQIAMKNPKATAPGDEGLVEFLEAVVGTDKYVEPINVQSQALEKANELRQEMVNRVKMVEKEKEALEGSKTEAEVFLSKELELRCAQAQLFQVQKFDSEQGLSELAAQRDALSKQESELRKAMEERNVELTGMEKRFRSARAEYDSVTAEMERTKADFAAFERKDVKYREDLKHDKAKEKKLEAAIARHRKNIEEMEKKLRDDKESLPEVRVRIKKLEELKAKEESALEAIFESLKGKTEHLRVDMEAKQKELIPLRRDVNATKQDVDVTQSELRIFNDKVSNATAKHAEATKALGDGRQTLAGLQQQLKEHDKHIANAQKRLPQLQRELQQCVADEDKAGAERQALRCRVEEGKSALAMNQSRGAVLDALLKAKKRGVLPGIIGRLGDLGAIDKKYDVAVSTAAPALQYVLVDTADTAMKCAQFLRDGQLGRAMFVILEKMDRARVDMSNPFTPPAGAQRLFDLIQVANKEFLPAFYYALGNTLVVEDIERASQIAYAKERRNRVVTLDGKVIEVSGTMSGGGDKVLRGLMGAKLGAASGGAGASDAPLDAKEIESLETSLQAVERQLQTLGETRRRLEKEVSEAQELVSKAEVIKQKLSMDCDSAATRIKDLESRLESLEAATKLSADEKRQVQALNERLAKANHAFEEAQRKTQALESEIAKLEQAIMDAGGAKLRAQQTKVSQLAAQLDEANSEITKIQVNAETSEGKITKAREAIDKTTIELEAVRTHLATLTSEFKTIEDEALKVMEAFKAAEELQKAKASELGAIEKEYDALKKGVDKIRAQEVDVAHQLEELTRTVKEDAAKAKQWEKKLQDVRAKIDQSMELMRSLSITPGGRAKAGAGTGGGQEAAEEHKAKSKGKEGAAGDSDENAPATNDDQPAAEKRPTRKTARRAGASADDESDEKKTEADNEAKGDDDNGELEAADQAASNLPAFRLMTEDELATANKKKMLHRIAVLEEELRAMKPNMAAIEEYRQKEKEYVTRAEQLDKATEERDQIRKVYETLRKKRLDEFMAGFSFITLKLKEMYQMLTLGGDAELELVDSLDPFSEGIVFSVRPPKKSWKSIQHLSGGEKTLSSLALIFALHHYKPTPLYVMDEIDAALDFKNVSIVANYIKDRTKNAQFIIISLRNNMFELADRLIGIYKTNDDTKSITIDPRKFQLPPPPAAGSAANSAVGVGASA